jgi:hypothetical protein
VGRQVCTQELNNLTFAACFQAGGISITHHLYIAGKEFYARNSAR